MDLEANTATSTPDTQGQGVTVNFQDEDNIQTISVAHATDQRSYNPTSNADTRYPSTPMPYNDGYMGYYPAEMPQLYGYPVQMLPSISSDGIQAVLIQFIHLTLLNDRIPFYSQAMMNLLIRMLHSPWIVRNL